MMEKIILLLIITISQSVYAKYRVVYLHNNSEISSNSHSKIMASIKKALDTDIEVGEGVYSSIDMMQAADRAAAWSEECNIDRYLFVGATESESCLILGRYLREKSIPFIPLCLTRRFENKPNSINYKMGFDSMIKKIIESSDKEKTLVIMPRNSLIAHDFVKELKVRDCNLDIRFVEESDTHNVARTYPRVVLLLDSERQWIHLFDQMSSGPTGIKEVYAPFPPSTNLREYFASFAKAKKMKIYTHVVVGGKSKYEFWENMAYIFYSRFKGISECSDSACVESFIEKNKKINLVDLIKMIVVE